MKLNEKPKEAQEPEAKAGKDPMEAVIECMARASRITVRQRRNRKGTSITLEFKR